MSRAIELGQLEQLCALRDTDGFLERIAGSKLLQEMSPARSRPPLLKAMRNVMEPIKASLVDRSDTLCATVSPEAWSFLNLCLGGALAERNPLESREALIRKLGLKPGVPSSHDHFLFETFPKSAAGELEKEASDEFLYGYVHYLMRQHFRKRRNAHKQKWIEFHLGGLYELSKNGATHAQRFAGKSGVIRWQHTQLGFGIHLEELKRTDLATLAEHFKYGPYILKQGFCRSLDPGMVDRFFDEAFDDRGRGCYEGRTGVLQDYVSKYFAPPEAQVDEDMTLDFTSRQSLSVVLGNYLRIFSYTQARAWAEEKAGRDIDITTEQWKKIDRALVLEDEEFEKSMLTSKEFLAYMDKQPLDKTRYTDEARGIRTLAQAKAENWGD